MSTLDKMYETTGSMSTVKDIFYDWHGLNQQLFLQINSIHSHSYDQAMILLSKLGDHRNFQYYVLAVAIYALLSLLVRKWMDKAGAKTYLSMWVGVLLVMSVSYVATGVTTKILKHEFGYPRPYIVLDAKDITVLETLPKSKDYESFPSGHAVFIMLMIVALWPVLHKNLHWIMVLLTIGVGWSRIALGVHFPVDVLAGFLLGGVFTPLVRSIINAVMRTLFKIHC